MKRLFLWFALAAGSISAVCMLGRPADGAGAPLTLAGYQRAVHAARVSLDRLLPTRSQPSLARIRRDLRSLDRVRLPDGRTIGTDLPQLAEELAPGDAGSIRRVSRQLDTLDARLRSASRSRADPHILAQLDSVLRDARFHQEQSLWSLIGGWLRSLALRLLATIMGTGSFNPVIAWIFGAVFLALIASVGFLAARGGLGRMVVDVASADEPERPVQSAAAWDRAEQQEAAGDHRSALRYLFLATMLGLQERGALELRPGLTNHEYLSRLRAAADAGQETTMKDIPSLQHLVEEFDRAWYGHRPFGAADFARCKALARQILAATPGRRVA